MTKDIYKRDENEDKMLGKRNIIMMVVLIVLFLIGIIYRWDYVSGELSSSVDRYINPTHSEIDSVGVQ